MSSTRPQSGQAAPAAAPPMAGRDESGAGVQFPETSSGRRSSTATSALVLAAAVESLEPALAQAMREESRWRQRYGRYLVDLVRLAVRSGPKASSIARHGLEAVHETFRFERAGESMTPRDALHRFREPTLHTAVVQGTGERRQRLVVPYRGEWLEGDALRRQIDAWAGAGVMEPAAAGALHRVCRHEAWLDLRDLQFVLLGAGAELGPFAALSRLGAGIIAVDLDRPDLWRRLLGLAREHAGRLVLPLRRPCPADATDEQLAQAAGCDLLTMTPEIRTWLASQEGPLCIGGYAYLHGQHHVRVEVAMDAIMEDLARARDDVSLAFLLTPTDVFAIPEEAAAAAKAAWRQAGLRALWRRPLCALSNGRLYAPNAVLESRDPAGRRYPIFDGIVPAQGPNYALAKRLQKWRAVAAREAGVRVSANVAPPTATASVLTRRAFAAAYAGAPHYGAEIFAPETANALMTALLIHDLRSDESLADPAVELGHPLDLFSQQAVHGGLWRIAYQLRSVLEMAAIRGFVSGKRPAA